MSEQDWKARAEREASAIIAEVGYVSGETFSLSALTTLLAAAWLQGVNLGCHETLAAAEMAFEGVKAEL